MRQHDLARQRPFLAMFRFAKVQILTRLLGTPLLVPFVNGTGIYTCAGRTGANGNYYLGLHECADMAFTLHYLRPKDIFVDVGANIGSYTLLASGGVGATSISFEPVPETLTRLHSNLEANHLSHMVDVRPVCLGCRDGTVSFTTDADTINHIVESAEPDTSHTIEVPIRRLDNQIADVPVLIKIDAESFDDEVLAGSDRLLCGEGPMALLIETVGEQTRKRLSELRFKPCSYDPFSRKISEYDARRPGANNYLFIRDVAYAQARVLSAPHFDLHGFGFI